MTPIDLLAGLAACGVRLTPQGDHLAVRGPRDVLTPDLLAMLRRHKADLMAILRQPAAPVAPESPTAGQAGVDPPPAERTIGSRLERFPFPARPCLVAGVCRCGSTTWRDVLIHEGRSVRRDCAGCGRFLDFPVWYGKDALQHGM
jgi:hypothetical protein